MRRRNRRSLPVAVGGGRGGGRDGGKRPLQTGNMRPIDNDNILPTPLILYYMYTRLEHIVLYTHIGERHIRISCQCRVREKLRQQDI
jgi:hypothetical protein